jgi:uncharacterized membrane protein YccF (DUF307 family)
MNLIENILWLIFGGLAAAIGYVIGGIILCVTIIGIPFGLQCFKIAGFVLWPFGRRVVNSGYSLGCLTTIFNIIWIVCGGFYTACVHLFFAFILAITIIGLPFAKQHLKLVELSLMPFGKSIVG